MHNLNDLTNQLNNYLNISQFTDFCVNGMQIEGKKEVGKIATAVSASLNVIQEAVKRDIDLLIVHHGLFWDRDSPVIRGVKRDKIALLLKAGISLLAYHLPLDAHRELGNNWKAAIDLGWTHLEPFFPNARSMDRGKGEGAKNFSRGFFKRTLEDYYGQKAAIALGGKEKIESCALISGGAYKQIADAAANDLDCFITGNFDEPAWHLAHEEKINFFALGHAATEKVGPRALADFIRRTFNLDATFIEEFNPF